jgi:hypothetical protein
MLYTTNKETHTAANEKFKKKKITRAFQMEVCDLCLLQNKF